jgi:3-oxoacyl-[acyl-carrier protein] reductase
LNQQTSGGQGILDFPGIRGHKKPIIGEKKMNMLTGKRALVTGSARGIGFSIARKMAQEGAKVILNDVQGKVLEEAAKKLKGEGFTAEVFEANITDEKAVADMFKKIESNGPLHILVNNAGMSVRGLRGLRTGVTDHVVPKIAEMQLDEWNGVLALNMTGTFLCTRAAVTLFKAAGTGRIINLSSKAGRSGGTVSDGAYVASKAGIIGFTKQCAKELGSFKITANSICPGLIFTDILRNHFLSYTDTKRAQVLQDIPLDRPGEPEEIASVVAFLASDGASYVTGVTMDVNGGWYFA